MAEEKLDPERIKALKPQIVSVVKWSKIALLISTPISILFIGVSIAYFALGRFSEIWIVVMGPAVGCAIVGILVLVFCPKTKSLLYRNKRSSTSSFSIIAVEGFRLHYIHALVCFLHLADNAHQRLPMEALAIEYRQGVSKGD